METTQMRRFERLEDRNLLAADLELIDGTLIVCGTDNDDTITVTQEDGTTTVNVVTFDDDGEVIDTQTLETDEPVDQLLIKGEKGDDVIINDTDIDSVVFAGKGADTVIGGDGRDVIFGGRGKDTLVGLGGNDVLFGGKGKDVLFGGEGIDVLIGGKGRDLIIDLDGEDIIVDPFDADTVFTPTETEEEEPEPWSEDAEEDKPPILEEEDTNGDGIVTIVEELLDGGLFF